MNKNPSQNGLIHQPGDLSMDQRKEIRRWLSTLNPIWENRYSTKRPLPDGQEQRTLLRPVYWLGNWQFACLDYYHPPKGIENRCVHAEPYPHALQRFVQRAEDIVRGTFSKADVPRGWELNTCLINFYGDRIENGKTIDCARVGEHKDFELGPVVSLSLGERALFQFVKSQGKSSQSQVILQQWLGDGDLQIFGGYRFKKQLFHRVQRVEDKNHEDFRLTVENFRTRRVNFTFRYVPREHIQPWHRLPQQQRNDTREYVRQLAGSSEFFAKELAKESN